VHLFVLLQGWLTMFRLGRACLCRRDAPTLGGLVCPLCWRCSGMALGLVSALIVAPTGSGVPVAVNLVLVTAAWWLPALIDVVAQVASRHAYRSHRLIRLVTGLALGVGIVPASQLVKAWLL
jgi:uncharacterized membrane protein